MSQNTSSAVMQQRSESHDSLDFFPTPPWATRALCEYVLGGPEALKFCEVWEPACGEGHMARPLAEYFSQVYSSDVHQYGFGDQRDFLFASEKCCVDWVITNPPFRLAVQFIEQARWIANKGVAMLVRNAFMEGVTRYNDLFSKFPPNTIAQFVERVPMVKGRYDPDASTATAYCWLVWRKDGSGKLYQWIPPCRRLLERAGDYA